MTSFTSLYTILQVPKTATVEEIKTSYRKLAKTYHPDINNSPESETAFILIHNAYQTLSDQKKRDEYDFYLSSMPFSDTREKSGLPANLINDPNFHLFSLEELLSHINYFLWDIEIFLTKDYNRSFDKSFDGTSVKEHVAKMLVFIDK